MTEPIYNKIGRPKVYYGPNVNVKLSEALGRQVMEEVAQRRTSISEVVRIALEYYYAGKPKLPPRRIPYHEK